MEIRSYSEDLREAVIRFLSRTWEGMGRAWEPNGRDNDIYHIPELYQLAGGQFWAVVVNHEVVATAALKPLSATTAELKRFYVSPPYRGKLGRTLFQLAYTQAVEYGFNRLRLDTNNDKLPRVLQRAGFQEIPAYYHNPKAKVFLELRLDPKDEDTT